MTMTKTKKIGCGFDCGGTNLKCYYNVEGKEEIFSIIPTGESFTKWNLINEITDFVSTLPDHIDAIGIAFCGMGSSTHIYNTPRNYLKDLDVSDFAHLDCTVSFINDANAATLCGFVENPDSKVLVGITNGTGIGSGLCINGNIFLGANGLAGEITGNILSTVDGPHRAWQLCSGSLLKKAIEANPSKKDELIRESATNFGFLVTHVVNFVNPDVVYLAGGVFDYPNYFETVLETINTHGVDYMIKDLRIVLSTKGTFTGCIGTIEYAINL